VLRRVDLPDLLDPEAPGLRVAAFVEPEPRDDLLAEVPARAFGEQRVLADEFDAGNPAKTSTPSASACCPSQRTTLARLTT
jgi:hypothetical protein